MNKMAKMATLVAFTAVFSVFSVKPAVALDLGKTMGGAIKSVEKSADKAVKTAVNAMEPKGPIKVIQITGIPSEYESFYAQVIAVVPETSTDICMPSWLTLKDNLIDTVEAGKVKTYTPCDDKKRLITLTLTKTKDENNTSGVGFIYAKDAGSDVCKTKEKMPTYKLSELQVFHFADFMLNEDCKKIADKVDKTDKAKSKK